jgi:hypothetical protein
MPRIEDEYLECAIYMYETKRDAEDSKDEGATGFIVAAESPPPIKVSYYAVTNTHVIRDDFTVIRVNTREGGHDVIEVPRDSWISHPLDDVSVCPIEPTLARHKLRYVRTASFLSEGLVKNYDIGPGDEVFMVGRFIGLQGTLTNLPIARFGAISMLPSEEIENPIGNRTKHFLVEVRSIPGFSGSPVFVYDTVPHNSKRATTFGPTLLGVDCGHFPSGSSMIKGGIAPVVPAWRISEVIRSPEITEARKRMGRTNP